MKAVLVIETVLLVGLTGSYLGLRARVKHLEKLIETWKMIAKYKDDFVFYKKKLGETE